MIAFAFVLHVALAAAPSDAVVAPPPPTLAVGFRLILGAPYSPGLVLTVEGRDWEAEAAGGLIVLGLGGGVGHVRGGPVLKAYDWRNANGSGITLRIPLMAGISGWNYAGWRLGPTLCAALSAGFHSSRTFAWMLAATAGVHFLFDGGTVRPELNVATGPKWVF